MMHFDFINTVFEPITRRTGAGRQFPLLAHHHEAFTEFVGQGGAKDEPARVDADDIVDRLADVRAGQRIDGPLKTAGVRKECGDVVKTDPLLGEIRDLTDRGPEICNQRLIDCVLIQRVLPMQAGQLFLWHGPRPRSISTSAITN